MNRMWDKNDLIKLIEEYAPGFDPSSIEEGNVPQDAVLGIDAAGELVKGNLFGKYARVLKAPQSDILTDDEISAFTSGCMIEGNFYGFTNPIIFPHRESGHSSEGVIMGIRTSAPDKFYIQRSYIWLASKAFATVPTSYIAITRTTPGLIISGKTLPAFPTSNGAPAALCVDINGGDFKWQSLINNIAPEFSEESTYTINDLVMHNGTLYKCTTAVTTAGAWNAAHWTQTTLAAVIAAL